MSRLVGPLHRPCTCKEHKASDPTGLQCTRKGSSKDTGPAIENIAIDEPLLCAHETLARIGTSVTARRRFFIYIIAIGGGRKYLP